MMSSALFSVSCQNIARSEIRTLDHLSPFIFDKVSAQIWVQKSICLHWNISYREDVGSRFLLNVCICLSNTASRYRRPYFLFMTTSNLTAFLLYWTPKGNCLSTVLSKSVCCIWHCVRMRVCVFITETECVYCAVRTESLNIIRL